MPTLDERLDALRAKLAPFEVPLDEREQAISEGRVGELPSDVPLGRVQQFEQAGRKEFERLKRTRQQVLKQVEGLPTQPHEPSFLEEWVKPASQAALDVLTSPIESVTKATEYFLPRPEAVPLPDAVLTDRPVSQPRVEGPPAAAIQPTPRDLGRPAPVPSPEEALALQGPPARPSEFYRTQVEPFVEAGKGVLFRMPKWTIDQLDRLADLIHEKTGLSKGGLFKDLANLAKQQAEKRPVDPTWATEALSAAGEAVPKAGLYMSLFGPMLGLGLLGMTEGSQAGTKEALVEGFKGLLTGAAFKGIQGLSMLQRAVASSGLFTAGAVAEGERDPAKLAGQALTGGLLGIPGPVAGETFGQRLQGYAAPPPKPINMFTRLGLDPATVTLPELRQAFTQQARMLDTTLAQATSDAQRQAGIAAYQRLVQDFRDAQQVLGRRIPVPTAPEAPPTLALPPGTEALRVPGAVTPGAFERPQIPGPPVPGEVRGGRIYGGGPIEPRPERFDVLRPGQGRLPQVPTPEEAIMRPPPAPKPSGAMRASPLFTEPTRRPPTAPIPSAIERPAPIAAPVPVQPPVVQRPAPIPRRIQEEAQRVVAPIPQELAIQQRPPFLIRQPQEAVVPIAAEVTVEDIHRLADAKGIPWDNDQTFMALTEQVTGKRHLDTLTPAERQEFYTVLGRLSFKPASTPRTQAPVQAITPEAIQTDYPSIAETKTLVKELGEAGRLPAKTGEIIETVPRHDLPAEENAELYARALKAKADMEIAGRERGGKVFLEQQGQGGTPEVIGLKSPTARWFKEATSGPGKLSRERVERAVQKILEDQGRDTGKDVERIKDLLFQDREFMKTPFAPKTEAEWQALIQEALQPYQAETAGLSMILPSVPGEVGAPRRRVPTPTEALEARQQTIPVPPATIGERPIIAREVTPEEAPLFSKQAQTPEPEQTSAYTQWFEQAVTRHRQENAGQAILDRLEDEGRTPEQVVEDFWNKTYNRLPGAVQKRFERYITRETGFKPGSVIGTDKAGTAIVAKAWRDVYPPNDMPTEVRHLEGTERGLIALMEEANTRFSKAAKEPEPEQQRLTELGAPLRTARPAKAAVPTPAPKAAVAKPTPPVTKPVPVASAQEIAEVFRQEATDAAKKARPRQPRIPVAPITGAPAKPLTEIMLDLEKGLGQKLTIGKPGPRRAGVYQPGSTATIIRYSGDLDTTAHELAHALDDRFGLVKDWKGQQSSPFDAELEPFAQHGSVSATGPQATPTYRRAEGVAEWTRAWVVNPQAAEAAAPRFAQHVKDKLPKEIQQSLTQFSDQVRQWAGNSAHAKIMANVQWETPESGLLHWLTGGRTAKGHGFQLTVYDQLASVLTDRLAPFMKAIDYVREERGLTAKPLPGTDPALLARLYMGVHAKMDDIFAKGMIDAKMDRATAGGLNWMLEPLDRTSSHALERDMQEVASLMIAQRTVERIAKDTARQIEAIKQLKLPPEQERTRIERVRAAARQRKISGAGAGIEEDITVAESRLRELGKERAHLARLTEAADRYRQWADANLQYLVQKGRLSSRQYEAIKANNEYYVAMQRLLEVSPGEELIIAVPRGAAGRKLGTVGQPIKAFKGSTRTIKNPYLSLMDATYQSIKEADRNEVLRLFRDLLTTPRGMYEGEPAELASVGRLARSGEKHTIPIYKNGEKEIWQFHPEVYKALKGIEEGAYKLPPLVTILPRILRSTIVNAPPFALRNLIRDAWHRTIMSEVASKPWDTLKPYNAEEISKLKRSGGDQAGHYYSDSQNYARALKFAMGEAVKDQQSIVADPAKVWHWAKKGGEGYLDLMQQSERQGRLAEYRRALEHAKTKLKYDDYHAMLYAASQARGLLDYAVAGHWLHLMNQVIPFSNAAVQGVRVNVLRAKADPARYAARFGIFAVVPALLTYAWNYLFDDDLEEYRQLPAYQRDLFWNFKLGPDLWLKIPKPFEIGVLATTFERALDAALGNENAFEGHVGAFLRTLLPVDEASFAGPAQGVFQATANYDFFRDRPIIPRWEENLALELRSTHRGSRLGQALQEAIGVDSRKIDFIMQQQFGYLGRWAVDISDIGRKEKTGFTLSASGVLGPSPAGASLDVRWVMDQAEERGVVASKGKVVERLKSVKDVRAGLSGVTNLDAVRYGVFRKIVDTYHEAQSSTDRDRLAAQVRQEATLLRTLWEKQAPNPKAEERARIKRQREAGELTKQEAAKQLKRLKQRRVRTLVPHVPED